MTLISNLYLHGMPRDFRRPNVHICGTVSMKCISEQIRSSGCCSMSANAICSTQPEVWSSAGVTRSSPKVHLQVSEPSESSGAGALGKSEPSLSLTQYPPFLPLFLLKYRPCLPSLRREAGVFKEKTLSYSGSPPTISSAFAKTCPN